MLSIEGLLSDGKSSRQQRAFISHTHGSSVLLKVIGNDSSSSISEHLVDAQDVNISSRLGSSARYLELGKHGRLETRDNDGVDQLADAIHGKMQSSLLHKLESNLGLIFIALLITIAVSWGAVKHGIPAAADAIVEALPKKTTDFLESKLISYLEEKWFSPSMLPEPRQAELQSLFKQVQTKLGVDDQYTFKLRLADEELGANAIAFPSGTIVMTDQLIELAKSDQQIAGVMAHEIGHLDGKHSLRQVVRGAIFTFLIAFFAGDASGVSAEVLSAPALLIELQYSRDFESEADQYALRYFGCDKQGLHTMGEFFLALNTQRDNSLEEGFIKEADQLKSDAASNSNKKQPNDNQRSNDESADWSDFLSTHPRSEQRKALFENHIKQHCR